MSEKRSSVRHEAMKTPDRHDTRDGFRWPPVAGRWPLFSGRLPTLIGAGAAFALALMILVAAGLPEPAELLALQPVRPGQRPVAAVVGALAPPFTVSNAAGETLRLETLRGGPVVVNFWATWCIPCQTELPTLQTLFEARREGGLHVLAVNVGEPPGVFVPWAAARGLTFDLLPDEEGDLQALYRVLGVPQTVVIGPDGVIGDIIYGAVSLDRLAGALDALE